MAALPDLRDFRSLLVVKPSSMGDIILTLPAVSLLRAAHPHLRIRWVANSEWAPLLEGSSCADEVIPFPRKAMRGLGAGLKFLKWSRELRSMPREEPELVIDFQGLLRSALIAKARGAACIMGMSDSREGAGYCYDFRVETRQHSHAVERYLAVAGALGVTLPKDLPWPLQVGTAPAGDLPRKFGVLHPWSRGEGKSLSPEVIAALVKALHPHPVVLVGVTPEKCAVFEGGHVIDLSNQTSFSQLIWLMRNAAWNISVDSGPMHLAAALNERTLSLHTWSDPRKVGPYSPLASVWKAGRIARRGEFSESECVMTRMIQVSDVQNIADYALHP